MIKKTALTEKTTHTTEPTLPMLHNWNIGLALFHALQGCIVLLLSATRVFPVNTSYLAADPISSELAGHTVLNTAMRHLFDINMACLIAVFFFISAIAHGLAATFYRNRYEADLKKKINRLRWIEYALSASTMMVAIAVLSGVVEFSLLVLIFVLDVVMNLMGLAMETYNQGKNKPNWLAYIVGCVAGIAPWFVFAVYAWGANVYGDSTIPAFVYWIYASMLVLFSSFAVNMFLQYKKTGKWKNYLYGERMYMILSLVAKTVLAWQIFAGALRP